MDDLRRTLLGHGARVGTCFGGQLIIQARAPPSRAQRGALRGLATPQTRVATGWDGLTYSLQIQPPPTAAAKTTTTQTVSRRAHGCQCRWYSSPPNAQASLVSEGQPAAAGANTGGRGHQSTDARSRRSTHVPPAETRAHACTTPWQRAANHPRACTRIACSMRCASRISRDTNPGGIEKGGLTYKLQIQSPPTQRRKQQHKR